MLPQELWKQIQGYEGLYAVSTYGNVMSLRSKKILKPLNSHGYDRVVLSFKGKIERCLVHRLVAQAFIPNPDGLPQINHKDENKKNNFVDNLEWCTPLYNTRYGTGIERQSKARIGVPLTEERKLNISKACKGRNPPIHTAEGRKRMSEAAKRRWNEWRSAQ